MEAEKPKIAVDPNLATEQQQARATLVDTLQTQAQGDTAALMARYGTRLALSNTGVPSAAPAPSTVPALFAGA